MDLQSGLLFLKYNKLERKSKKKVSYSIYRETKKQQQAKNMHIVY